MSLGCDHKLANLSHSFIWVTDTVRGMLSFHFYPINFVSEAILKIFGKRSAVLSEHELINV